MQLVILVAIICIIYLLANKHPFLTGLVAMVPVKMIAALFFGKGNLSPIVDGLLLGSALTTGFILFLWLYLKWA